MQAELTKTKDELSKACADLTKTTADLQKVCNRSSACVLSTSCCAPPVPPPPAGPGRLTTAGFQARAEGTTLREEMRKAASAALLRERAVQKAKEEVEKLLEQERKAVTKAIAAKEDSEKEAKTAEQNLEKCGLCHAVFFQKDISGLLCMRIAPDRAQRSLLANALSVQDRSGAKGNKRKD